jgi:hypothetical protein
MFRSAITVIPLVTYPIIAAPGLILEDFAGLSPRGHRLAIALGIPLFLWLVLSGFMWMLWNLYKGAIPSLTSSLSEVGPDVMRELRETTQRSRRLPLLVVIAGLLLIVLALLASLTSQNLRR